MITLNHGILLRVNFTLAPIYERLDGDSCLVGRNAGNWDDIPTVREPLRNGDAIHWLTQLFTHTQRKESQCLLRCDMSDE